MGLHVKFELHSNRDTLTYSTAKNKSKSFICIHGLKNHIEASDLVHTLILWVSWSLLIFIMVGLFLAATKQLYEWYFLSVCPSVRLSVRLSVCLSVRLSVCPSVTPFWLCSHHRIIMKFSGVITFDQGKVHAKGQGQRSKVKVTEVTTQIFVSGL